MPLPNDAASRPPIVSNVAGNSTTEIEAVHDGLIVLGDDLDGVTALRLVVNGVAQPLDLRVQHATSLEALFTDDVPPGRHSLELESAAGVASYPIDFARGPRGATGATGAGGARGPRGVDAAQTTSTCAPGTLARSITANGTLSCASFDGQVQPTDGASRPHRAYAVQPADFRALGSSIPWGYDGLAIVPDGAASQAGKMIASVHLPQGATIVSFGCLVVDNDNTNDLTIDLRRASGSCGTPATTSGSNAAAQFLTGNATTCTDPVSHDNTTGALGSYAIVVSTPAVPSALRVNGCTVRFAVGSALP